MKSEIVAISKVKPNQENPRTIKDDAFKKLVKSIKDFPEMLSIRPIVVNKDMVVLGGNMRLKACIEAGLKKIPIIRAGDLTAKQQKEFIIKDNISGGDWDWDLLATDWDSEQLNEWGLDIPNFKSGEDFNEGENAEIKENQWFLNIEFTSESECQQWYEKLIKEGLICKIIQ